jgi:hypothetical protein
VNETKCTACGGPVVSGDEATSCPRCNLIAKLLSDEVEPALPWRAFGISDNDVGALLLRVKRAMLAFGDARANVAKEAAAKHLEGIGMQTPERGMFVPTMPDGSRMDWERLYNDAARAIRALEV